VSPDDLSGFDCSLNVGCGRTRVARRGEVRAIVGEHRVDLVRHGGDQVSEEISRNAAGGLFVQLDESELRCPVDRHEEVELSLFSSDFGDVNMEIADREALNFRLRDTSPSAWGN
jgi:hypothetical protein